MKRPDAELVEAACGGDVESFRELYERYYRLAVGVARGRVCDQHLAEDVAQEAFSVACKQLATLRNGDRFAAWLAAVCRRIARKMSDHRFRTEPITADPVAHPEVANNNSEVRTAVEQLPATYREVIQLHYFSGFSYEEIGRVGDHTRGCSRSPATCSSPNPRHAVKCPRRRNMMNEFSQSQLDDQLRKALGQPDVPDFAGWSERHKESLAHLNPVVTALVRRQTSFYVKMTSTVAVAATVAVVIFVVGSTQQQTFAQTLQTIERARTITWMTEAYTRCTSKEGSRTWLRSEGRTEHAFKAPDLYRDTFYDRNGELDKIQLQQLNSQRTLVLDMKAKKAIWGAEPRAQHWGGRPFEHVAKILDKEPLEYVGQRAFDGRTSNVFRRQRELNGGRSEIDDYWIDSTTKQLVRITNPGVESAPDRDHPAEATFSFGTMAGVMTDKIVFNAELDSSLFDLTPPAGFEVVQQQPPPPITENDLIEFLEATAKLNDATFVETPRGVTNEQYNTVEKKKKSERTGVEQKFFDLWWKHHNNRNNEPIADFGRTTAIPRTFKYLGKGVKLGDTSRIVCWYRLNGSNKFRVVYGDLSIKEVDPKELPLPVSD